MLGIMRAFALLLCLVGCTGTKHDTPADASHDGTGNDSGVVCYGTGNHSLIDPICFTSVEVAAFPDTLPSTTIDTTTCADVRQQGVEPDFCLVVAKNVDVSGTLRAIGSRPLVVIGANHVHVTGTLDAASHQATPTIAGAGADFAPSCPAPLMPIDGTSVGAGASDGGGAGGGGGYQGQGGVGTFGATGTGGFGGPARPLPGPFAAGCFGGSGGAGLAAGPARSHGGGGIYLIAGTEITVSGTIAAWGAGGLAGGAHAGGAGGGSGGLIALDAPTVSVTATARLLATGGGGGEGGSPSVAGVNGMDGDVSTGGSGAGLGGDGGNGGRVVSGISGNSNGLTSGCGGGGGGGAAGWVFVFATTKTLDGAATIAPPASS